eukprot:Seg2438.2 transcript_id=Seg2438.2/GoldUCD/mRNA.D3Y31 product="hypothetical protein" protein_id=Seg2438.2/GoldUCD/D3Y31
MGKDKCCASGCYHYRDKPEDWNLRGHVAELKFHRFPSGDERQMWESMIRKGLDKLNFKATSNSFVCSNHFEYGRPTPSSPYPTLFLTVSDSKWKKSPHRRRRMVRNVAEVASKKPVELDEMPAINEEINDEVPPLRMPMTFQQIMRESNVRFFTGLCDTITFKFIFDKLLTDAKSMKYWKGEKLTSNAESSIARKGPARKLSLEQEFLLTLMKLRLGLLNEDLAFRFDISVGLTSQIFFTWIRLMALDLHFLIKWPSRHDVKVNLPEIFKKYFPRCVSIIDCTEFFVETPSSVEVQAALWSEYKHHCTIKVLIAITPNGVVSFLSDAYGGRSSDKFIVQDCDFLDRLRPGDQLMADKGFKIADILAFHQCSLVIPPSAPTGQQMTSENVRKTSRIANARIYVENAIGRVKNFRILKNELPILLLPIADDIIKVCSIDRDYKRPTGKMLWHCIFSTWLGTNITKNDAADA